MLILCRRRRRADLEGGVGRGRGGGKPLGDGSPQWGPGAKPRQGVRGRSPPEAGIFLSTQPEI